MLQQQPEPERSAFSDAADWRALEEQLGSPDEATAVGASVWAASVGGIRNASQLRDFVANFQARTLAQDELPIILRAYHHARRNEARELVALDQSLQNSFANEALSLASQTVGRNQLRRLRGLKDERVVRKYWDAVHAKQASGWHTIVFGVVLAIYSIPLRQGLHHYSRQTMRGFLEAGAASLQLRQTEIDEMETALLVETPAIVEAALASEGGQLRCV